jgi:2-polyprenyl-6-hydroxyphenyl methylase / 3-demethylubiquinone-9 3-methyltransferase
LFCGFDMTAAADSQSDNADPGELAKFQALASRWWDATSEFAPLHAINPLRLRWIEEMAGDLEAKQVVDVGCGGGILTEAMAQRGATVTGIDLGEKALQVAELHALDAAGPNATAIRYEKISAEALAAREPGAFDVVTCMELLEHVPEPESTIAACAALAKPGGWVIFSTLNRNPKAFAFAIVGAEYFLGLLPRGTHDYEKFIKPSELVGAARGSGLELVEMIGLTYSPLTKVYRLVKGDVSVNYMVAFRKS